MKHPVLKSLVILLISAVIVVALFILLRPRTLLERATLISSSKEYWTYVWLTPDDALLFHEGQNRQYKVVHWNNLSRVETREPKLEQIFSTFNNEGILPSPDGQWLLCLPFDGEAFAHIVKRDGSKVVKIDVDGDITLAWMSDSKRILHVRWNVNNGLNIPGRIYRIENLRDTTKLSSESTLNYFWGSVAVTPNGAIIIAGDHSPQGGVATNEILELSINGNALQLDRRVTLPTGTSKFSRYSHEISPNRQYIASDDLIEVESTRSKVLGRFIPSLKEKPQPFTILWAARTDGSQKREIGRLPEKQHLEFLGWVQGTNRIFFHTVEGYWSIDIGGDGR